MSGSPTLPTPTWFVGCGNMGGAIIEGWRASAFDLSSIVVIRPSGTAVEGTRTVTNFAQAGPPPKLVAGESDQACWVLCSCRKTSLISFGPKGHTFS